jgi:hypothetical protein
VRASAGLRVSTLIPVNASAIAVADVEEVVVTTTGVAAAVVESVVGVVEAVYAEAALLSVEMVVLGDEEGESATAEELLSLTSSVLGLESATVSPRCSLWRW